MNILIPMIKDVFFHDCKGKKKILKLIYGKKIPKFAGLSP